ncbi:MAG: TonB-dependent receptor, partial [Arenimonas sp.]|nr:TonB-dependent receptor [Arenimonas sp.]
MRYSSTTARRGANRLHIQGFRRSALALGIALLIAGPAMAQDATKQDTDEKKEKTTDLEKVTVTGIRGSVQRAQDIKREADTFVDSVTALDIGALPDRSVTETLSRIPGVTIDRFLSVGDPEHFSAEGGGVQVRGLTQVRSELNGRDSFSASGGRGLSFQDVPSELMAGVDVFKNQTAAMIEGGLGGTVNLRTFMPFDFEGRKIAASLSANFGDFVKEWKPSASALYSNRWKTEGGGEVGILVDIAHSELATRTDGLFVRPFFKNSNNDLNNDDTNEAQWLPRGADWRTLEYERKRDGAYVALQWRPNNDLELFATAFQSRYDELWFEDAIFVSNDPLQVKIDASQPYELEGNIFKSGRLTQNGGVPMGTDIRASHRKSKTADFSFGLKWMLTDADEFSTDLQFIKADTNSLDSTVALGVNVPYIDVTLGGVPSIGINQQFTTNPANYYWGFTMDHQDKNEAEQVTWRADLKHSFDNGVFRSIKFGVRVTDRDATNIDTGYNWKPVFQTWMQWWALPGGVPMPPLDLNGTINQSRVNLNTFENFYRGGANTPGAFYAPNLDLALGFPGSYQDIHDAAAPFYSCCFAGTYSQTPMDASRTNVQSETTQTAYAMASFGFDEAFIEGNFGVRVVRTENDAQGYLTFPNVAYATFLGSGQATPITARNAYNDVLPSVNVKWEPRKNLVVRFAASKAIARPNFSDMQAYQVLNASVKAGVTPPTDGSQLPVSSLD